MKRSPKIWSILCLIAIFAISGCAGIPTNVSPIEQAQEQVQKIMDAYIIVYDKTMVMATDPNITESEKVLVAANKKIVQKVWPALLKCVRLLDQGIIPSRQDLDTADDVLDLLEEVLQ